MARVSVTNLKRSQAKPPGLRSSERRFVAAGLVPVGLYMLVFLPLPLVWGGVFNFF